MEAGYMEPVWIRVYENVHPEKTEKTEAEAESETEIVVSEKD